MVVVTPELQWLYIGSIPMAVPHQITHKMITIKFTEETKEYLIGRMIINVGDNYIVLDNGCRIYLDESEIQNLN
jgi:hypothetical protein